MKRVAFKLFLNEGQKLEYQRRHEKIWPELKKVMKDAGISDYSIFLDGDSNTLFAVQTVSGDGGSQELGQLEVVRKWWEYMADIMRVNPDNSPVTEPLEELFYLE